MCLAEKLAYYRGKLTKYLYIGRAKWEELIYCVGREERKPSHDFYDEQIWTFLVACGYGIAGEHGIARLTKFLTSSNQKPPTNPKIWFEVSPISPRKKEGETYIDLALGTITAREGSGAGIELENAESSWICFCEMKWYNDIAVSVTHDIHRNQLARVIENAICFQKPGKYAEKVFVTLVTPSIFRSANLKSRLYQYKFEEYDRNRTCLIDDLNKCILERNDQSDLNQRVRSLSLQWATYDELFENFPDSAITKELKDFWQKYGNYQGKPIAVK